mmetsp:Transcript_19993/g.50589  ORF Transcript_19993/g.50589 Transcript_19993/m.50589 type:complete len:410 (-) Transcript_19993:75-1304(-)
MPPKAKEAASAHAKKVEDKTFGMKNKNKSKQVQAKIQQMHKGGGNNPEADHYDRKKKEQQKAAADALDMVLFKEAKKKSEIKRAAEAACQAKEKDKEPEKRDIHVDLREQKQQDEMAGWDDEKLKRVVEQKKRGGDGERAKTDIVCKYFLDAIETKKYGWFWECPNGGDKCQYRHALPPGYVLKSEIKEVVDTTELLEDRIERERRALTTRTPVTLERLQLWLKNKQERKAEQENLAMEEAKENYKKGKRPVISGRALFAIDPSLFIDDDAAGEGALEREESDDDDEGERKAVDFTPLSGPSAEEHAAMMAEAQAARDAAEALAAKEKAAAKEAEFAAEAAAFAAAKAAKAKQQEEQASSAPAKGHAEEAGASSPAPETESPPDLAAADLEGVDESLFLGEDFDDVDIE